MMCGVQWLCISPLGARFTKMAASGSEKAFCVLTFHYGVDVCRITKGAYTVISRLTKVIRSGITFVSRNLR